MTEPTGLVVWNSLRYPGTCQTVTDVDEGTGELVVTVWGEPPAPEPPGPPSGLLTGVVVEGRVAYQAENDQCILKNVRIVPRET